MVGGRRSSTVTVAVQLAVFPFTSVTVRVTGLAPVFVQVKADGDTSRLVTLQASLDPLSISLPLIAALPVASSWTVKS
jgi:hypothetical protein